MKRKICILTSTRAEYGLLKHLMAEIRSNRSLELQTIVTGSHMSPEFGYTFQEIETDGFAIDARVEILLSSDSVQGVAKAMGLAMISLSDALERLTPDILVILGDRFEILSAAAVALVYNIPIAHLHGGETTEGAIDEAIRHAVTKMASLHFVAAQPYFQRVVQMGELPERVFNFGGLGVDAIGKVDLINRQQLEAELDFRFGEHSLLITFHPETQTAQSPELQTRALLDALSLLPEKIGILFTMPNADAGGRQISAMIKSYADGRTHVATFESLGQRRYLSCLAQVSAVVGNSSSGLTEVPSFGIPTVNIGQRQDGRLRAESVIDCPATSDAIARALGQALSPEFRRVAQHAINPYGSGGASHAIASTLAEIDLDGIIKKRFFDLPNSV
ncbi:UDP-N-acetylglucosamine 2-epimerase (hydrolyzing) [Sphingomonas lacunae]|uniref:UDP-N-acetylglucosamine 2-epimerase (Hydrolyzing) n=1 Tax=Sphingomonas lacunae TaxID=2698828 RepID=A0A6M4AUI1_9SPHN|nr:UDP-N-acetylglucosamine 2-epimerase [Sphingomonas lacunae]QJQ32765.1 UDP-N-acetylglucosamine 2-epimerase (hydrolyzing) [Sphingomonas lacunae]